MALSCSKPGAGTRSAQRINVHHLAAYNKIDEKFTIGDRLTA